MDTLFGLIQPWLAAVGIAAGAVVLLTALHVFIRRRKEESRFTAQLVTLAVSLVGLISVVAALPVSDTLRGQLLSFLGILFSAAIALSATTFVGNAMAGLMLRALRNFRPGDFIQVGDHLGRVSERGLFHTEIQTESSDLATLPNLYLVTQPVTVVRATGTIVSAMVSLGYDVPRRQIQVALLRAASVAELEDAFVQITELGDFSISYRVAGRLRQVTTLLSARSHLREAMLDALHGDGIEIVSPTFMNTRSLPLGKRFIPQPSASAETEEPGAPPTRPEAIVFDKAEEAASNERLREILEKTEGELETLEKEIKEADDSKKTELLARKETLTARAARFKEIIQERKAENHGGS